MMSFANEAFFSLPQWAWMSITVLLMAGLGAVAVLARKLTFTGAFCAAVFGFMVLSSLRFEGLALLLLFFVSCNLAGRGNGKHGPRDRHQVFANGFLAAVAAVLFLYGIQDLSVLLFGAAVAEATSDTFAGEIGRKSVKPPVSIVGGRPVKPGLSGGVTVLGMFAGLASSVGIALAWKVLFENATWKGAAAVAVCGFAGCLFDSLLGATCQALYRDAAGNPTEDAKTDGMENELVRGLAFMDNSMVNLLSNAFSCALCMALSLLVL